MPPLICPPPELLDQSFPRNESELTIVAVSYGYIGKLLEEDTAYLLITEVLSNFIELFEWENSQSYPLLREIHRLLQQWVLQPHDKIIKLALYNIEFDLRHPVPKGSGNKGMVDYWSIEISQVLAVHKKKYLNGGYCIGVACANAFAGFPLGEYEPPACPECLPLVGPTELSTLKDAFVYDGIPANIHSMIVTFSDAFKNLHLIGATKIDPPDGSSHYKVHFPGHRPWVLDINNPELPDRFLNQLVDLTIYPIDVIKTALKTGVLPKKVLFFETSPDPIYRI